MQQIRSIAGDTVGVILFRYLNRDDDEAEKAIFEINPHLAFIGPILPAGIEIIIPKLPPKNAKKVIRSWD